MNHTKAEVNAALFRFGYTKVELSRHVHKSVVKIVRIEEPGNVWYILGKFLHKCKPEQGLSFMKGLVLGPDAYFRLKQLFIDDAWPINDAAKAMETGTPFKKSIQLGDGSVLTMSLLTFDGKHYLDMRVLADDVWSANGICINMDELKALPELFRELK